MEIISSVAPSRTLLISRLHWVIRSCHSEYFCQLLKQCLLSAFANRVLPHLMALIVPYQLLSIWRAWVPMLLCFHGHIPYHTIPLYIHISVPLIFACCLIVRRLLHSNPDAQWRMPQIQMRWTAGFRRERRRIASPDFAACRTDKPES